MILRILHLSDFHFRALKKHPVESFNADMVTTSMLKKIDELANEKTIDLVIITGDIVFSGKKIEYEIANEFFRKLQYLTGLSTGKFFMVPGNHDVDRSRIEKWHLKSIYAFESEDEITETLLDKTLFPILMRKFEGFHAFANLHAGMTLFDENHFYYVKQLPINKDGKMFSLNLLGLNSALFAGYDGDDKQKIALGLYQVEEALQQISQDALISIAFFHHPFSCFHPVEKVVKHMLTSNVDILLHGHLHEPLNAATRDSAGEMLIVGAGTGFELRESNNSFNLIEINPETGKGSVLFYKYLHNHNYWNKNYDVNPHSKDGSFPFTLENKNADKKITKAAIDFTETVDDGPYITRIELINIRCFKHLIIDLEKNNKPVNWLMILGDNSAGKSTLIRSIALGLCNESDAISLIKKIEGDFVRKGSREGSIELHLCNSKNKSGIYKIKTKIIKKSENEPEIIRQKTEPSSNFPWLDIFVCGYGTNRAVQASASYEQYNAREAMESLFDYNATLQNPEVVLLRRDPQARKQIEQKLLNILMLDPQQDITYPKTGFEISGPWGNLPFKAMSDGYRSSIQWILDFIGWAIYADRFHTNTEIGGILLIDEIEQHLHPQWQRYIVRLLNRQFPQTQIISTTHTPLTASGIVDIENSMLLRLKLKDDGDIEAKTIDKSSLEGKRADQVLASEAFGLITTKNPGSEDDLDRYAALAAKSKRSNEEEKELQKLRDKFRKTLSIHESELAQAVEIAVNDVLQKKLKDVSPELLDLEIKKQLHEIFKTPDDT